MPSFITLLSELAMEQRQVVLTCSTCLSFLSKRRERFVFRVKWTVLGNLCLNVFRHKLHDCYFTHWSFISLEEVRKEQKKMKCFKILKGFKVSVLWLSNLYIKSQDASLLQNERVDGWAVACLWLVSLVSLFICMYSIYSYKPKHILY